ncbi:hypothetical protein BDV59DRAFT_160808 [Aspergillus ambiguus]|uniref:uncharacterized protein n=1 Tax=Aspergillus ambiguus TaxID=176160 RepID=UPI003CCD5170
MRRPKSFAPFCHYSSLSPVSAEMPVRLDCVQDRHADDTPTGQSPWCSSKESSQFEPNPKTDSQSQRHPIHGHGTLPSTGVQPARISLQIKRCPTSLTHQEKYKTRPEDSGTCRKKPDSSPPSSLSGQVPRPSPVWKSTRELGPATAA